jgi:hypothetical protein
MGTFRCSAGHVAVLQFDDHVFKQSCPKCGVDVFKFRDLVYKDQVPEVATPDPADAPIEDSGARRRWKVPLFALAGLAVLSLGLFVFKLPAKTTAPATPSPAHTVPEQARSKPSNVRISGFTAVSKGPDKVKLSFRLTNLGGPANVYPSLMIHWQGTGLPGQLMRPDAYPHPKLPFKSTTVRLELTRPAGATGIDVQAVNQ